MAHRGAQVVRYRIGKGFQLAVGSLQSGGAGANALLELLVELADPFLGALAFADVDQHVHRADQIARSVMQRRRVGNEGDARAVGPLGDGLRPADRTIFLERHGHRALVVAHRPAVRPVEAPGNAPFVRAEHRPPAGQGDGRLIEEGDPPFCVGRVYGRGQGLEKVAQALLAFAMGRLGPLARGDVLETVDGAGHRPVVIHERIDVDEGDDPRAVRALDHDFLVAHRNAGSQHIGHRAFHVGKGTAVEAEHPVRPAEALLRVADLGRAAPKLGGAPVVPHEHTGRIAYIGRRGQQLQDPVGRDRDMPCRGSLSSSCVLWTNNCNAHQ